MHIFDFLSERIRLLFKKLFPNLYYSEKMQRFWFNICKPSPLKIILFLLAITILIVIFSALSQDDPATRSIDIETYNNLKTTDQF